MTEQAEREIASALNHIDSCPFCRAGRADLYPHEMNDSMRGGKDKIAHWIACSKCGASGPVTHTLLEAISQWNRKREESHVRNG